MPGSEGIENGGGAAACRGPLVLLFEGAETGGGWAAARFGGRGGGSAGGPDPLEGGTGERTVAARGPVSGT